MHFGTRAPSVWLSALLLSVAASLGCDDGGDGAAAQGADSGAADGSVTGPVTDAGADEVVDAGDPMDGEDASDGPDGDAPDSGAVPGDEVPAAEPVAYSEGACPELVGGRNTFRSAGLDRQVDLYVPRDPQGVRVLFMWHPLGSSAQQIAQFLNARVASQQRELLIVVPESRRTQTEWGYAGNDAAPDLALFDDLLSCLDEQYGVDRQQVFTTGFSAGALWSTYLVMHRAEYLAGAVILSGGVSPLFSPYRTPGFTVPTLIAWGGPNDTFRNIVDFEATSEALRDGLLADGHFVMTCVHDRGHVPPPGVAEWGYDFMDDHDVRDGTSPYADGLPESYPEICALAASE